MHMSLKQLAFLFVLTASLTLVAMTVLLPSKAPDNVKAPVVAKPGIQTAYSSTSHNGYSYLDLSGSQSGVIFVKAGNTIEVLSKANMVHQAISPSGQYIGVVTLSQQQCHIYLYDMKSGNEQEVAVCPAGIPSKLSWSSDNTLYFVHQYPEQLAVQSFNPVTGDAVEYHKAAVVSSPKALPAPNVLAFMSVDSNRQSVLKVLDEKGNERSIYRSNHSLDYCFSSGRFVVAENIDVSATIKVIDLSGKALNTRTLTQPVFDLECQANQLFFSQKSAQSEANIFKMSL